MKLPPVGAQWDYQLGGAYTPPAGVTIVERDSTASPAKLGYDICYLNGFQTQSNSGSTWPDTLLLLSKDGKPEVDPNWRDEHILNTSTAANRDATFAVVQLWIQGCADKGFDAVGMDNLDSDNRTGGRLSQDDNYALAKMYVDAAHAAGLVIAQSGRSFRFQSM